MMKRTKIYRVIFLLCFGISMNHTTHAQVTDWSMWATCLGSPCLTGIRTRTRTCNVTSCVEILSETEECAVMCDVQTNWGPFQYGECESPEPKCMTGTRQRIRSCLNSDTGDIISPHNCPGGFTDATNTLPCNTDLCSSFSDVIFGTCTETCNSGYRINARNCTHSVTNLPPDCLTVLELCNTDDCVPTQYPTWGRWDQFNICSSSCSPGTRTRSRSCLDENDLLSLNCTGDEYEEIACNQGYCVTYSQPITTCTGICDEGLLKTTKSCIDIPVGFSPPTCTEQISIERCIANPGLILGPSMDILFLMATSFNLDSCGLAPGIPPFNPDSILYNNGNFPNFFRQVDVVTDFLDTWNEISITKTRVAIDVWGSQCGGSLTPPIIPTYLNDSGSRQLQLDEIPIRCSSDSPISLYCSAQDIFSLSKGDRPDVINTVVYFMTDATLFSPTTGQVLSIHITLKNTGILDDVTLFILSTLNPDDISSSEWETQQQWLRKFACFTTDDIEECPYFLGSMWQDTAQLFTKLRDQVEVELESGA